MSAVDFLQRITLIESILDDIESGGGGDTESGGNVFVMNSSPESSIELEIERGISDFFDASPQILVHKVMNFKSLSDTHQDHTYLGTINTCLPYVLVQWVYVELIFTKVRNIKLDRMIEEFFCAHPSYGTCILQDDVKAFLKRLEEAGDKNIVVKTRSYEGSEQVNLLFDMGVLNTPRRKCETCGTTKENVMYCKSCFSVAYCCKEHQKIHWKEHKETCKQMKNTQVKSLFKEFTRTVLLSDILQHVQLSTDNKECNVFKKVTGTIDLDEKNNTVKEYAQKMKEENC